MQERYFLYWEDVDWNARAAAAGWRSLYVPTSRVWHKVTSASKDASGEINAKAFRYEVRNRILFHRRHYPWRLPRVVLGACRYAMVAGKGAHRRGIAVIRGTIDGLLNRTGPIRD
jgi:GT2 family glycosyltransferase